MLTPSDYSTETLKNYIGHEFDRSDSISVDQLKINEFATVTGDHQWIHVNVEKAKELSPFGGAVAHGFLTLSLLAAAVETAGVVPVDAKAALNYGLERTRFLSPVLADTKVYALFVLADVENKGSGRQMMRLEAKLIHEGTDKPAIVCELLVMVIS